jgi:undecaprenyl diphosphate synthase
MAAGEDLLTRSEARRVEAIVIAARRAGLANLTLIEERSGRANLVSYFNYLAQHIGKTGNSIIFNVLDERLERENEPAGFCVNLIPDFSGKADVISSIKRAACGIVEKTANLSQQFDPAEHGDLEAALGDGILTGDIADPDLMVFFDGRKVLGEAGVWMGAYSEFAFLKEPWRSFSSDDLNGLLEDYGMRERRFGAV